ncbi:hypothetical protein YC2023_083723 [Brassica napus]
MTVYILRRANFPTFGAMNEDAPGRGLFKFWAHMFDYRDGHIYGSHSLRRRSGTEHPNLVYWYSVASEPSLNHPNPRLTLRRRYKLQDNETLSIGDSLRYLVMPVLAKKFKKVSSSSIHFSFSSFIPSRFCVGEYYKQSIVVLLDAVCCTRYPNIKHVFFVSERICLLSIDLETTPAP